MLSASKSLVVGSIPGIGMVEKNFFFFIFYDFVVFETFGEILVLGSIPGVGVDIFFYFFFQFGGVGECPWLKRTQWPNL